MLERYLRSRPSSHTRWSASISTTQIPTINIWTTRDRPLSISQIHTVVESLSCIIDPLLFSFMAIHKGGPQIGFSLLSLNTITISSTMAKVQAKGDGIPLNPRSSLSKRYPINWKSFRNKHRWGVCAGTESMEVYFNAIY